jgi:hypothetical protein
MPPDDNTIARFSAKQTADFFGGGLLGRPEWTDPEVQRKQDLQRQKLREALDLAVKAQHRALHELSPETARRMLDLYEGAVTGNEQQLRLFVAMHTELAFQALMP